MNNLTAADLVQEIAQLGIGQEYNYVSGRGMLRIVRIVGIEGPIRFERYNQITQTWGVGSVTVQQLTRIAYICSSKPNYPIHIDRVFSAGGNSRSALETMLAYTPNFFTCYPQRTDIYTGEILQNLKHFMWCPEDSHPRGQSAVKIFDDVITEMELGVNYGDIRLTNAEVQNSEFDTIDVKRTHVQMQIALIEIGNALGFRTWIARNDRSIRVGATTLGAMHGVIQSLDDMQIFYKREIKETAALIDCIWFTADGDRIPAIIEIEHSTGVTSGLTRMGKLRRAFPSIKTVFTVVAPNELRNKVITEANQDLFRNLDARYMPYSTVRELYGLIQRYALHGVVDHNFIYPFMEKVVDS